MNPHFLHLFLFGDTKRLGGGEEVQQKNTHMHIHTHMQKKKFKKTRDIINI